MYARIATFEGATDLNGAAAEAQQGGPPEGLKATEAYLFGDGRRARRSSSPSSRPKRTCTRATRCSTR